MTILWYKSMDLSKKTHLVIWKSNTRIELYSTLCFNFWIPKSRWLIISWCVWKRWIIMCWCVWKQVLLCVFGCNTDKEERTEVREKQNKNKIKMRFETMHISEYNPEMYLGVCFLFIKSSYKLIYSVYILQSSSRCYFW